MSAPLPSALRARFQKLIEEGLSGRAAAFRLDEHLMHLEAGVSFSKAKQPASSLRSPLLARENPSD